ncbi:MAG: hypothetical protein JWR52_807 [Marmoricola sp.]|nr:hypothetical protein [Marmoricola sp.]
MDQAVRLPLGGAVSGWASLRWRGASYFTGLSLDGSVRPVPMLLGGAGDNIRSSVGVAVTKEQFPPAEMEEVDGLRCSIVARALFDEVRAIGTKREGAVAIDMAIAAGLTAVESFAGYVAIRPAWRGVPLVRQALSLAHDHSRSPQESRMRLVWILDAGLPPPLCNSPVFDLAGQLLGYPDLLDPVAGVIGEYDGVDHLERDRRRGDIEREQRFRDHGFEYFTVVRGDLRDPDRVVRRMRAARNRALFLPASRRSWTLDAPPWFQDR